MEAIASRIQLILEDYENNEMTVEHILHWVEQFEETDREFILAELEVIFTKCYFSKKRCIQFLKGQIEFLSNHLKYTNTVEFLNDVRFLDLQPKEKASMNYLN